MPSPLDKMGKSQTYRDKRRLNNLNTSTKKKQKMRLSVIPKEYNPDNFLKTYSNLQGDMKDDL